MNTAAFSHFKPIYISIKKMTYKIKWYFVYDVVGNIITVEIINSFQYFIKKIFHNTRLLTNRIPVVITALGLNMIFHFK